MKAQEKIYPLLNLSFFGDDGTGNFVSGPATTNGLIAVVDGVVTTGSVPISLTFVTNAEAMRINPVGNVGFGTTTPVEIVDISGNIQLKSIGNKIKIKEGSNASMGIATLVAGTVTVPNTIVTANSRIMLTAQSLGTITVPAALAVSARTPSVSFTILSSNLSDTSVVAWTIFEPAP